MTQHVDFDRPQAAAASQQVECHVCHGFGANSLSSGDESCAACAGRAASAQQVEPTSYRQDRPATEAMLGAEIEKARDDERLFGVGFCVNGWHVPASAVSCWGMSKGAVPKTAEQMRPDFEWWYTTRGIFPPIGSRECAAAWSAWLASGNYTAPGGWQVSPTPWGLQDATSQQVEGEAVADLAKIERDVLNDVRLTLFEKVNDANRHLRHFDLVPGAAWVVITEAVRRAIKITAREVADPVWPYAAHPTTPTSAAVPAGHVIVPVVPTVEMLDAGRKACQGHIYAQDFVHGPRAQHRDKWAAMLAAAPTQPAGEQG